MMSLVIGLIIAGVLMVAEHLLCTKLKNPLWGGIIPMAILIGTIIIFATGIIPFGTRELFPFMILIVSFFGGWVTGRDKFKKNKQAELDKMIAKDI